jgi:hypothetical protein
MLSIDSAFPPNEEPAFWWAYWGPSSVLKAQEKDMPSIRRKGQNQSFDRSGLTDLKLITFQYERAG